MSDPKQVTINLRVRPRDLALIDKAAKILGKTRSSFIRDAAVIAAERWDAAAKTTKVKP